MDPRVPREPTATAGQTEAADGPFQLSLALGDRGVLGLGGLCPREQGEGGVFQAFLSLCEAGPFTQLEENGHVRAAHVHGVGVHQEQGLSRVMHQLLA